MMSVLLMPCVPRGDNVGGLDIMIFVNIAPISGSFFVAKIQRGESLCL